MKNKDPSGKLHISQIEEERWQLDTNIALAVVGDGMQPDGDHPA